MTAPEGRIITRGWQVDERVRASVIAAHDLEVLRDRDALTRLTDFAAALCETPVALVTVMEDTRQTFLARTGTELTETPREISFCRFAILGDEVMVVPDATADARFVDNPLVTGDLHIRFYAGAPLITDDGVAIGSLCVLDTEPHPLGLTPLQRQGLDTLAGAVLDRMRDSRDAAAWRQTESQTRRQLGDSEQRFRTLADAMPQMVWSTLPDGFHDYYNARWYAFTGMPAGSTDGEGWNGMFHPDDRDRAWTAWRHSLKTGEPYSIEYRLRHHDGSYRWVLGRAPVVTRRNRRDHPLVWNLHRHRRAETGIGRTRSGQPGAEPPDQEHLFGHRRAYRVHRARPTRVRCPCRRPARSHHRAGPRA